MTPLVVIDYDPQWPARFAALRAHVWPAVSGFAVAVEHVGSTSVPGLAAKPVIDLDVVVAAGDVPRAIEAIASLGYEPLGELGVPLRQAFRAPPGAVAHNLYVCVEGSTSLENHLRLRDHLRQHPEDTRAYGDLKRRLAGIHAHDRGAYTQAKTAFILGLLRRSGLGDAALAEIEAANR